MAHQARLAAVPAPAPQPPCRALVPSNGSATKQHEGQAAKARARFRQQEGQSAPRRPSQEDTSLAPVGFNVLSCFSSDAKANGGMKFHQGVNRASLKSYRRQHCSSGEPANGTDAQSWCSHTISIVCCGHHQTPASIGVPAITELVLILDAHKSGWGFPLHRCHTCCTCLVTSLLTHHFSTFTHPTGMWKVRERAFWPKPTISEW